MNPYEDLVGGGSPSTGGGYRNPYDDLVKPDDASSEEEEGVLSRGLHAVGSVLGAPKAGIDYLARAGARAQGLTNIGDQATTGSMLRSAFGLSQGDEGYAGHLGGRAVEFAGDVLTDPVTYAMGAAPKGLAKAAGATFTGLMGVGAAQEAGRAYEGYQREGFTPQVAEEAFGAGLSGLGAYAGAKHLLPTEHETVSRVIKAEPPERLTQRLESYTRKGRNDLAEMVQAELASRQATEQPRMPQVAPEGIETGLRAAEVQQEPIATPSTSTLPQGMHASWIEEIAKQVDRHPEVDAATPEEAQATVAEVAGPAEEAARRLEEARRGVVPAVTEPVGQERSVSPAEGPPYAVAGGDNRGMAAEEGGTLEPTGVPASALDVVRQPEETPPPTPLALPLEQPQRQPLPFPAPEPNPHRVALEAEILRQRPSIDRNLLKSSLDDVEAGKREIEPTVNALLNLDQRHGPAPFRGWEGHLFDENAEPSTLPPEKQAAIQNVVRNAPPEATNWIAEANAAAKAAAEARRGRQELYDARKGRIQAERAAAAEELEPTGTDIRYSVAPKPTQHLAEFALKTPIKGNGGNEIVGYEWRSKIGEVQSEREGGLVTKRISDWDRSDTSKGTGRDIVHVFHVRHPDGTITREGIGSANRILGINESRLKTIAKNEAVAQRYRAKQDAQEVAELESKARDTPAEAARLLRMNNPRISEASFDESVFLENNGRFIRTFPQKAEILQRVNPEWKPWSREQPTGTEGEIKYSVAPKQPAPKLRENRLWPEQIDQIPSGVLSFMSKRLKSKGFDVRGPEDVRELLRKREGRFPAADWFTAYNDAVASTAKAANTRAANKGAMPHVDMNVLRRLGTTSNPESAGYIRPDGSLVNMSGPEGGARGEDHRIVGGTAGMQELMANGHIRWMPESNGLDVSKEPSSAQYRRIEDLAGRANGEMILDLEDGLGEFDPGNEYYRSPSRKASLEYPSGTNPRRIAGDIRRFFAGEDFESGTRYSAQEKPKGFFSQLERAAKSIPQAMKGSDLYRYLTDQKRGVKAEEMKWVGLDDFLKERSQSKVTPQEVQDFINQNKVEVKEVRLGGSRDIGAIDRELDALHERGDIAEEPLKSEYARLMEERVSTQNATKFSQYQEPGGENYREVLLTLPERPKKAAASHLGEPATAEPNPGDGGGWLVRDDKGQPYAVRYAPTAEAAVEQSRLRGPTDVAYEGRIRPGQEPDTAFRAGHFDEPNVLAHVRLNDRVDAEGKRVLFVEEIQSDWAQKGRREGFKTERDKNAATLARQEQASIAAEMAALDYRLDAYGSDPDLANRAFNVSEFGKVTPEVRAKLIDLVGQLREAKAREKSARGNEGPPSGPFVGSTEGWTNLALKRILQMAAEKGYDKVAWTTGEQQSARYDLSKQVDSIRSFRNSDGTYKIVGHKGDYPVLERDIVAKELPDAVGKDLADKILANPAKEQEYSGLDLKVGGEGMKGFYDQIVPSVANKLGKKWGVKVGESALRGKPEPIDMEDGLHLVTPDDIRAVASSVSNDDIKSRVLRVADVLEQEGPKKAATIVSGQATRELLWSAIEPKRSTIGPTVHALDITPEMRRSITQEGLPLFKAAEGPVENPVATRQMVIDRYRKHAKQVLTEQDGSIRVKFKDGQGDYVIRPGGDIEYDPGAFGRGRGREMRASEQIVGSAQKVGSDMLINLRDGVGPETLGHEELHGLLALGRLKPYEVDALWREHGYDPRQFKTTEEAQAAFRQAEEKVADTVGGYIRDRMKAEKEGKSITQPEWFQRMWAYIKRLYSVITQRTSAEAVGKRISSGEVYQPAGVVERGAQRLGQALKQTRLLPDTEGAKLAVAYHGSPHEFDQFDISKVGTGEGAQAFGHGLYFAENQNVAKEYQQRLGRSIWTGAKGEPIEVGSDRWADAKALEMAGPKPEWQTTKEFLEDQAKKLNEHAEFARNVYGEDTAGMYARAAEKLLRMKDEGIKHKGGSFYTVDIPDEHVARMLDWDKPFSEQPENVKSALATIPLGRAGLETEPVEGFKNQYWIKRAGGGRIARVSGQPQTLADLSSVSVSNWMHSAKSAETSAALLEAGIPGIKYLDQGSRVPGRGALTAKWDESGTKPIVVDASGKTVKEFGSFSEADKFVEDNQPTGTRNFVVFNDKLIKMRAKNNEPRYSTQPPPTPTPTTPPTKPTFIDKVIEAQKAGFVSAPPSHVANVMSVGAEAGAKVAESFLAAGIDRVLGGPRTRFASEAGAQIRGGMKQVPAMFGTFAKGLKDVASSEGKISKKAGGGIIRTPFELLGLEDRATSETTKGAVAAQFAEREARKQGWSTAKRDQFESDLLKNPTEEMLREVSRRQFKGGKLPTDPRDPTNMIQNLVDFRNKHKWMHFVAPFIETPGNIAKIAIERSPAGYVKAAQAYRAWKAGVAKGASPETLANLKGEAVDQIAKATLGTAMLGGFAAYAKAGGMTGSGPQDPKEKAQKMETGWQPYSFVVPMADGRHAYVPFNRFEPVSTILGFAADLAELKDQKSGEEKASKVIGSIVSNLSSKTYLRGLADAAEFINNPVKMGKSYIAGMAGTAIPAIVARGAQALDPTVRDVSSATPGLAGLPERVRNTVMSRVPGLSEQLPARLTSTGEEATRPGNALSRFLSPVQISEDKPERELERAMGEIGYAPGQPSRKVKIPGSNAQILLNDSEYQIMQRANKEAADYLRNHLSAIRRMKPDEQEAAIKKVYDRARESARNKLFSSPSFRSRARAELNASPT